MHDIDSTTVDIKTFPQLTKSGEAIRKKIDDYLDRMRYVGKTPSAVTLFVDDYDTIIRAIRKRREAAYRDSDKSPPPCNRAGLRRPAGELRREALSHAP